MYQTETSIFMSVVSMKSSFNCYVSNSPEIKDEAQTFGNYWHEEIKIH